MKTFKEYVNEAHEAGYAIGHFNVANSEMLRGVFEGAQKKGVPVIIGVSEGERDFIGIERVVAMVKALREKYKYPIFLNADHTYSIERVKEAIDAGFDSVIFDGANLSIEENTEKTRECVAYARESGKDVLIEAELGFIGTSSKLLDDIPEGASVTEDLMTKPADIEEFVRNTGIDLVAPAIGNVHGMLKHGFNPSLNPKLTLELSQSAGIPIVLHGGSGSNENDVKEVIKNGVSIVHISTEIRIAYKKGLQDGLAENTEELAPYRYMSKSVEAVKKEVIKHLDRFKDNG